MKPDRKKYHRHEWTSPYCRICGEISERRELWTRIQKTNIRHLKSKPKQPDGKKKLNFTQGFCCAVAELIRSHDEPTIALSLLTDAGITPKHIKQSKVDKYDLKEIEKLWVE